MTDKDVYNQALLGIYDRIYTGRAPEAFEMFMLVNKIDPANEVALMLKDVLFAIQMGQPIPEGIYYYFGEGWVGEDLTGKSILIVCDQGMGDILNLLGFIKQMKEKWDCRIVLNCYAHYDAMQPLMPHAHAPKEWGLIPFLPFIDEFSQLPVKCDYHTNLMSIPSILATGHVQYPALFKEIMERELPEPPSLTVATEILNHDDRMKVGVVFSTNKDNGILATDKSIPPEIFKILPDYMRLISLSPSQEKVDFIEDTKLEHLWDTATHINAMDVVVSVDTVVLHLAGLLGKPAFGLLHTLADPRWENGKFSRWYRSVMLFRQETAGDWLVPLNELKSQLEIFSNTL